MSKSYEFLYITVTTILFTIGMALGVCIGKPLEIQEVRKVDNGYYITINNEIYYKENSNE